MSASKSLVLKLARTLGRTARLMVGVPDYAAYIAHRRQAHPGEPILSYEDFFIDRQRTRYGEKDGKISRCC